MRSVSVLIRSLLRHPFDLGKSTCNEIPSVSPTLCPPDASNSTASSFILGKEVAFLINATSKNAGKVFNLMTRSIKKFVDKYGDENTEYQVVIHGDDSSPSKMCSKSDIDKLELKQDTTKIPALHKDLQNADFLIRSSETKSEKVKVQ